MTLYNSDAEKEFKHAIIEIGRRLWTRGYVAGNSGNITARLNTNEILTTPESVSKGFMIPEMILKISIDGKLISESKYYKPSDEIKLHLDIYNQREDVNAIVHSQPPFTTGFAVSGIPLNNEYVMKTAFEIEPVPVVKSDYSSKTEAGYSGFPPGKTNAVMLSNNGLLTFGNDLMNAYYKTESVEQTAYITFITSQLGGKKIFSDEEIEKLKKLLKK